jgi:ABC-2 type transport system permease protein
MSAQLITIFRRELAGYFATPLAYVFTIIFLLLTGIFTFYLGNFYERGQADLSPFFNYHPWLYLVLIPAIAMRLWAEERNTGTIELIMTLPVPQWIWVVGKFAAAWAFAGINLALTFPIWLTVNYLGDPDNGVIVAAYIGSWLMAGGYLAIGCCLSALTKSQVIAFVLTLVIGFLLTLSGFPMVLNFFAAWAPSFVLDAISNISVLTHFQSITQGVIALHDVVYFVSLIVVWLFATTLVIDLKKAE